MNIISGKETVITLFVFVVLASFIALLNFFLNQSEAGTTLTIGIMAVQKNDVEKMSVLRDYLKKKTNIEVDFFVLPDYREAFDAVATMRINAMFSSSAVASLLLAQDLAAPSVRPLPKNGSNTSWTVMLARKGTTGYKEPEYMEAELIEPGQGEPADRELEYKAAEIGSIEENKSGIKKFLQGKRVAFCGVDSSGDFCFDSFNIGKVPQVSLQKTNSQNEAIDFVDRGIVDIAIVNSLVWDDMKNKYPNVDIIWEDNRKNPSNTLMISNYVDVPVAEALSIALLNIEYDNSIEAEKVRNTLLLNGFVKTGKEDFQHTMSLLKRADVKEMKMGRRVGGVYLPGCSNDHLLW